MLGARRGVFHLYNRASRQQPRSGAYPIRQSANHPSARRTKLRISAYGDEHRWKKDFQIDREFVRKRCFRAYERRLPARGTRSVLQLRLEKGRYNFLYGKHKYGGIHRKDALDDSRGRVQQALRRKTGRRYHRVRGAHTQARADEHPFRPGRQTPTIATE